MNLFTGLKFLGDDINLIEAFAEGLPSVHQRTYLRGRVARLRHFVGKITPEEPEELMIDVACQLCGGFGIIIDPNYDTNRQCLHCGGKGTIKMPQE